MNTPDRKDPDSPERDAEFRQAWQRASDEQPSSRLDAAILAAAREAIGERVAKPQVVRSRSPSWLARWQPVAAAAAVTGLAFVLVQLLPRERDVAPSTQIEAPAAEAESQVPRRPPVGNETDVASVEAKPLAGTDMERSTGGVPEPAAVPPAEVYRPSASSVNRKEPVADRAAEVDPRDAMAPTAAAEAAPAATATRASVAKQGIAVSMSATEWAARVAALRDTGHTEQAADALRAFRAAYPDADVYLAESLRDWARTIE